MAWDPVACVGWLVEAEVIVWRELCVSDVDGATFAFRQGLGV